MTDSLNKTNNLTDYSDIFLKEQLAFIYANMGQYNAAIPYLERILLIEPNALWANQLFNNFKNYSNEKWI